MSKSIISDHCGQKKLWLDKNRFKVFVAGRRWGKTVYFREKLCLSTERSFWKTRKKGKAIYMAPTRLQTKDIMWQDLKDAFRFYGWKYVKNDSELRLTRTRTQANILLRSGEAYDRVRGEEFDYAGLDENADMKKEVFTEVIRPALSSRRGDCDLGGTPKGFNHFHDIFQEAKVRENWSAYSFKTLDSPFFHLLHKYSKSLHDMRTVLTYPNQLKRVYITNTATRACFYPYVRRIGS